MNEKVIPVPDAALSVPAEANPAVSGAEFSAAEQAAKKDGATGIYVHNLRQPFVYEGCTIQELTFNFDSLTGNDALAVEDEMQALNKPVIVPTFSGQYLIRLAARACTTVIKDATGTSRRIGADTLMALPIYEYNRIRGRARSFLLASES